MQYIKQYHKNILFEILLFNNIQITLTMMINSYLFSLCYLLYCSLLTSHLQFG